jgi:hypothetical protein
VQAIELDAHVKKIEKFEKMHIFLSEGFAFHFWYIYRKENERMV